MRLRRGVRARGAVVPRDAVRPPGRRRPTGSGRRSWTARRRAATSTRAGPAIPGPGRRIRHRDPHLGHVHGRRPADLERPLRAARHGAPDPDLAAVRRGPPLVGRAAAPRRRSRRCRSRRSRAASPTASAGSPAILDDLDRELDRRAHPEDHGFLRREGRVGFLVRDRGDGRALGYVYGSGVRADGSARSRSIPRSIPSLVGVAVRETPMLGPVALWVPGTADIATRALLDAGLRLDGWPGPHLLVAAGPPVRPLPADLAGPRLSGGGRPSGQDVAEAC